VRKETEPVEIYGRLAQH